MNWRRWFRVGRVERRENVTLITTPAGVYAVEDGIPEEHPYLIAWTKEGGPVWSEDRPPTRIEYAPGTTADHEPPSLYDWERDGL